MKNNKHAIIIIKNNEGKYLQYFDERWNSLLFLNCKLTSDNHFEEIKNNLKEKYGILCEEIDIDFVEDKIHSKFSESDQIMKEYHHYFYVAQNITSLDEINNNEIINNIRFAWLSMEELENNERVRQVNNDIVNFIKEIKI